MRANATDQHNVDRRGFFKLAAGGATAAIGLAAGLLGGASMRRERQVLVPVAAGAAGMAAATAIGFSLAEEAATQPTGGGNPIRRGLPFGSALNTADMVVETLIDWGVTHVFGVAGSPVESLTRANPLAAVEPLIEALRRRRTRIRYVCVADDQTAALLAAGFAKHSGRLGVCLAGIGTRIVTPIGTPIGIPDDAASAVGAWPAVRMAGKSSHGAACEASRGAIRETAYGSIGSDTGGAHDGLVEGLRDAAPDGTPIVVITGIASSDRDKVDPTMPVRDLAQHSSEPVEPGHAILVARQACETALRDRCITHLSLSLDLQRARLPEARRWIGLGRRGQSGGIHAALADAAPIVPSIEQLRAAAEILNSGRRVAIVCGPGAQDARDEIAALADTLAAPVAKTLWGRTALPDSSPFSIGDIGDPGGDPVEPTAIAPAAWAMRSCDTILLLGATLPAERLYPPPGQARAVQVDTGPDRIGIRYPVEVGLAGDVKATLRALSALLTRRSERDFLAEAQSRLTAWNRRMREAVTKSRDPLGLPAAIDTISELLADDAVISLDRGSVSRALMRHLRLRGEQRLIGTGLLSAAGAALPYAIAACLARPSHPSVCIMRDVDAARFMRELDTAVALGLPVKVLLLREGLRSGRHFLAMARSRGAEGFHCENADDLRPVLAAALRSPKAAVVELKVTSPI